MAGLVIGTRPLFTIGGQSFSDGAVWDLLTSGNARYSTSDPFVTLRYLPKAAPSRENGYNPPNIADTSNTVPTAPIAGYLPDSCWIFYQLRPGYYGYGQTEDYFGPLFLPDGKFLAIKFDAANGAITMRGYRPVSGGFSFGSDFLPGALATVAIAVGAHYAGELFVASNTGTSALFVGPVETPLLVGPVETVLVPAAIADVAPFVGPIEVAATTTPGWTLAETIAATKAAGTTALEGAKVVNQVAGAIGAGAAVVAAIKGPQEQPTQAPPGQTGGSFSGIKNQLASVNKNVWYAVGGIAVLLAMG